MGPFTGPAEGAAWVGGADEGAGDALGAAVSERDSAA